MLNKGVHKPILIVQGGQWGSEAKGAITAALCSKRSVDYAVRTGAINAGHTAIHRGQRVVMQQVPCGFVNPKTKLVIGAGAMIHPAILANEIRILGSVLGEDIRKRLFIDERCGVHLPRHGSKAAVANRHHKMGATGKGCSEALVDKISGRGTTGQLFRWWLDDQSIQDQDAQLLNGCNFVDTEELLNEAYDEGYQLLVEGTQGTLLDFHLGPYPYTTHKQTIAGQWALECGLAPSLEYETVLVMRTYPIRVAGNSGPMPRELSWVELAHSINNKLVAQGLPPMVSDDSMVQFLQAVKEVALDKWGMDDWQIERWSQSRREEHQEMVSELHKEALNRLPGPVVTELSKLFEMTTVTKKLRRVANFDLDCARAAVRQNRPAWIALTFLNYWYPQYWGCDQAEVVMGDRYVREDIEHYENMLRTPIRWVTTGPETRHVLDTKHGKLKAEQKSFPGMATGVVCKGKNCTSTDGTNHSPECIAEHEAVCNPGGMYNEVNG